MILDLGRYHSNTKGDGNTSILALEDEDGIANLIEQYLEMYGLKVCTFTNVLEALDISIQTLKTAIVS